MATNIDLSDALQERLGTVRLRLYEAFQYDAAAFAAPLQS
jgi:hypothetical protein